ncbi:MAG TPA: UDP-N-acetylmuramoyl-L-alanyl-D-glutamate--2,6-diaminopimelate ligase [Clostridiaceae bacterium]|nr:UDP-N-acetylmuramoyl-L-alanyl-D-glutamate--2,6-diaminopimelate ligase [Clostridiaceae bacterium]
MPELTRYTLSQYVGDLTGLITGKKIADDPRITGLSYDSRIVKPGSLFVCKGAAFKENYLVQARDKGAIAYIAERAYPVDLPHILVSDVREAMPILAQRYYNHPEKDIDIIGITGTKGKSTTLYMLREMLNLWQEESGLPAVAFVSTIETYDGVAKFESHLTTPEAMDLYRYLHNARSQGIKYLVMEVSSQGLKYNRMDGIRLAVAAFLNLSEDHISPIEHPDYEDYLAAKLRIFKLTDKSVLNLNIREIERIAAAARLENNRIRYYSSYNKKADIFSADIRRVDPGYVFKVKLAEYIFPFRINMPGRFNVDNALAAISIANWLRCPVEFMQKGVENAYVPGRMELFTTLDRKIIVLVDYAHNKLSFQELFATVRDDFPDHKHIAIFGCPGAKGISRRQDLGTVAGASADYIYLTEEDPRFEKVEDISKEIGHFIETAGGRYTIIPDRKEAIKTAFQNAEDKTLLLILGKGNETSQLRGSVHETVQSDISIARELIAEYDNQL